MESKEDIVSSLPENHFTRHGLDQPHWIPAHCRKTPPPYGYYAIALGREIGVFDNLQDKSHSIFAFIGAHWKIFANYKAAVKWFDTQWCETTDPEENHRLSAWRFRLWAHIEVRNRSYRRFLIVG
jgi:hypothetical protein